MYCEPAGYENRKIRERAYAEEKHFLSDGKFVKRAKSSRESMREDFPRERETCARGELKFNGIFRRILATFLPKGGKQLAFA